jgi:predicted AlkP superfamily phosphohydrolase/phosphomutase
MIVGLSALACGLDGSEKPRRVLLIGIDGASLRMLEPLLDRGALPHLAKIREQGVSGPLRSIMPLQSPRIWNSIATGKRPEKHGIVSFAHFDEEKSLQLYLGSDRKVHALWNIVSDAGMSVAVINWWNTFPPEKVNGVIVSDHLQSHEIEGREQIAYASKPPSGALTYPEHWEPRLAKLLTTDGSPIPFDDPFAENDRFDNAKETREQLSSYFRDDGVILRLALEVEAAEHADVTLVFFPGIDRVSHFLWGMIEPHEYYPEFVRPSPSEYEAGIEAFERYYEYTDAMIGALVEAYGPNDLVMVVSDHGFEFGNELGMLTGAHKTEKAQDGVIFARGAGVLQGPIRGELSVLDITPTILTLLGLPVGEDMDGRVADFAGAERVARIETHDTSPVERLGSSPSGSDERILENLRALGYLDEE